MYSHVSLHTHTDTQRHTHTHTQNPGPYGRINTSECNPVNRVSQMTKLIREILSGPSLCRFDVRTHKNTHPYTHTHTHTLMDTHIDEVFIVEHWSNSEITIPALIIRPQTRGGAREILSVPPQGHWNTQTRARMHTHLHGSKADERDALIHSR